MRDKEQDKASGSILSHNRKKPFSRFKSDKTGESESIQSQHDGREKLQQLWPDVNIDPISKLLFESANDNVAFTGVFDESTKTLYLHPLVPLADHGSGDF
jgi:hypothetical protein